MGSSDNFCLRWNDFEANISTSFREVRQNSEFFDVTLCCDNGTDTVQAHKLILAACSPLFRHILAHNSHTNTFLYLKGIQLRELQAILNFMYHGEVNVAQESLNKFLAVAEELAVKGLTTNENLPNQAPPFYQQGEDAESTLQNKRILKKPKRNSVSTPIAAPKRKVETDTNDVTLEVDIKRIKEDPDGTAEPQDDTGEGELYESGEYESLGQFDEDLADFDDSGAGASGATAGTSGSENKDWELANEEDDMTSVGRSEDDALKVESEAKTETDQSFPCPARYIRNQIGKAMLLCGSNYTYHRHQSRGKISYWKCSKGTGTIKVCNARAKVDNSTNTILRTGKHSHEPTIRISSQETIYLEQN